MKQTLFILIYYLMISMLASGQEKQPEKLLSEAIYQEEVNGDLSEVIKTFQIIIEQYPDNRPVAAKALLHQGMCYEKMGLKQARKTYQEIINKYPEQTDEVVVAKERINYLEAYAAKLSEKAEQHLKEGNQLFNRWEYESAIEEYKDAIKLDPNTLLAQNAMYCIGQSWFRAGRYDAALTTFKKLIEEFPDSNITPVTELMVDQVKHAMENNNQKVRSEFNEDGNTIVDPETGVTYKKVKTFTGKNDWISYTSGGFNMSPDCRFLVLENKVVPIDGSDPFALVDMNAHRAIYSPDMKKAAFYADSAIWIVPVSPETGHANGQPKKLLDGSYKYQHNVSWSPDGEKIAFQRRDDTITSDIWILSVPDGKLLQVTDIPGIENRPAWSPLGNNIVFNYDGAIWQASESSNEPKMIVKKGGTPYWSPDGKWLYLLNWESNHFYSLERDKNIKFKFPKEVGRFCSFSPNGGELLFYKPSWDPIWGLKVVSIFGGPSFKPAPSEAVYGSQWSANSKLILAQGENENGDIGYKIIPFTGGNPVEVKINVKDKPFPFRYSPDLTMLAFSVKREDGKEDLFIVPFSMEEASTTGPARLVC